MFPNGVVAPADKGGVQAVDLLDDSHLLIDSLAFRLDTVNKAVSMQKD